MIQVSVWVPVVVALIAAVPAYLGVKATRRQQAIEKETAVADVSLRGFAALVNELQEERVALQDQVDRCRKALQACLNGPDL